MDVFWLVDDHIQEFLEFYDILKKYFLYQHSYIKLKKIIIVFKHIIIFFVTILTVFHFKIQHVLKKNEGL